MRGIKRVKKGFSLIEVVISVAILVILMIPIASVTISTIKRNAEAEDKQRANFEGQKLLEELQSYNRVTLTGAGVATGTLPNNDTLNINRDAIVLPATTGPIKSLSKVSYQLTGENSDLYANYQYIRNLDATYDDITPPAIVDAQYKQKLYFFSTATGTTYTNSVGFDDDSTHAKDISYIQPQTVVEPRRILVLKIDDQMRMQLCTREFIAAIGITPASVLDTNIGMLVTPLVGAGDKILIKLDREFKGDNVNLYVESQYALPITFVIFKEDKPTGKVEIKTSITNPDTHTPTTKILNNINVQNNQSTYQADNIGDLYTIKVEIFKLNSTKPLFTGDAIGNVLVK